MIRLLMAVLLLLPCAFAQLDAISGDDGAGACHYWTSANDTSWTDRSANMPAGCTAPLTISFANVWWIGYNGGKLYKTTDPTTASWAAVTLPSIGTNTVNRVSYGAGLTFVCAAGGHNYSSSDQTTFSEIAAITGATASFCTFVNGFFVHISGSTIRWSTDLVSFSSHAIPIQADHLVYQPQAKLYLITQAVGGVNAQTSPDFNTWTSVGMPTGANISEFTRWTAVMPGFFVAVGTTSTTALPFEWSAQSTPATWNHVSIAGNLAAFCVEYNNVTGLVITFSNGFIYTTPDRSTFTRQTAIGNISNVGNLVTNQPFTGSRRRTMYVN